MAARQALMTPLSFEQLYRAEWDELEAQLARIMDRRENKRDAGEPLRGERVAELYRRACEHLALARARNYPRYLLDRLDDLTATAHQVIYQRREFGLARIRQAILYDFPRAVRAHAAHVWTSAALFFVPMLLVGWLVYQRPDLILSVTSAEQAAQYEAMYSDATESIGARGADSDWMMFGFYIRNNIGIAFQCFAAGIFFGVGSMFFLLFNGVMIGAIAGFLTERGLGATFYSFVVTHGAFELTAIVLAGAAGLRLGQALVSPGRHTRVQSLTLAARETMVIIYGFVVMLLIAAAIEAFWSSARWLPPSLKYGVAALCWIAVLGYLAFQGRRAD
ncbi:MAG TPA: stage II sporulation protein M [Steroidobacteraceae bacterium]|nr:stage II sporulation protein M [Steroidobacteraceae bacterium]